MELIREHGTPQHSDTCSWLLRGFDPFLLQCHSVLTASGSTGANTESQHAVQCVDLFPFHLAWQTLPTVNVQLYQKIPPIDVAWSVCMIACTALFNSPTVFLKNPFMKKNHTYKWTHKGLRGLFGLPFGTLKYSLYVPLITLETLQVPRMFI